MSPTSTETQAGIFKAPLTKSEMRDHVLTVSLVLARQLHFVFLRPELAMHEKAQAMLLGIGSTEGMNNPDVLPGPESSPLSFEHLADMALARTMDELYDFAYHGALRGNGSDMDSESSPSWISRILVDLSRSSFASEWHEYSPCHDAIEALKGVCETAEARMLLENVQDGDAFMNWYGSEGADGLTFRHMALLSGMSEASLRTLANPKRNNALKTISNGRNTYIEREDAKVWLISKGRYVPLANTDFKGAQFDLAHESIADVDELQRRLDSRLHFLVGSDEGTTVDTALKSIRADLVGVRDFDSTCYLNLSVDDLENDGLMRKVAKALQIPGDLLVLKAAHLRAVQQAQEFQSRFEEAARQAKPSSHVGSQ
jgi:hypothetical protein